MTSLTSFLRKYPLGWQIGLILLAVLLPLPLGDYYRTVAWHTGLYIILGLSLNIIVGYAGLFQLGDETLEAVTP